MAEMINGLFSSAPDFGRADPFGLIVMLLGVILTLTAKNLSRMFREETQYRSYIAFKLASVLICIAGFVIAII